MRIARIEAIAYGAIAGRVVEPEPGLTVIHGPNAVSYTHLTLPTIYSV